MDRWERLREIESLDPERDHARIYHLFVGYEFPWDVNRALEMALLRTFCVPSIARILDRTGEFQHRAQRRYDDTALLIALLCEHGYDHGPGARALARINAIHAPFPIVNDDFRYVLSTFVIEPIRWIDAYGWRPTSPNERRASFCFWREVGKRMGIDEVPANFDALVHWSARYEDEHFSYTPASSRVARAAREMWCAWFKPALRPFVRRSVHALLDDDVRVALGFPKPDPREQRLVRELLRKRGQIVRRTRPRTVSAFFDHKAARSYPDGYAIDALGPEWLTARGDPRPH